MIVNNLSEAQHLLPQRYVTESYQELVTSTYGLSEVIKHSPTAVVITGVPRTAYARNFHDQLVAMRSIPCDLPERLFTMKPAPLFIFILENERVRT